jgi:hypothetical protein
MANSDGAVNAPLSDSRLSTRVLAHRSALDVSGVRGQEIVIGPLQRLHRPWAMTEGSLVAIKWSALVLMVFDHVNKYLYAEKLPGIFQVGRIVMPMFGFVLAYNLARPGALASGVHGRMLYRLMLAGLAASPIFIILNGMYVTTNAWWPLNILFTLMLVVLLTYLFDRGGIKNYVLAIALFLVGGALVEYLWMGVLCCLGAWLFCRAASPSRLLLWCLGTLSLTVVNGNAWALVALPILLVASRISPPLPRLTWAFYTFYPAHLLILLGVRLEWF